MNNEEIFEELQVLEDWGLGEFEDSILVTLRKNKTEISEYSIGYSDNITISLESNNSVRVWSMEDGSCYVDTMVRILCDYVKSIKHYTKEEVKKLHGIEQELIVIEMENNETIEFTPVVG